MGSQSAWNDAARCEPLHRIFAREIERAVRAAGFDCIGDAADGQAAVEAVCRLKPDAILMDISMPRLDGIAAAQRIQKQCPTPVIILTAHESEELVAQAAEAGVGAYLTKPPKVDQVARAVAVACARFGDLARLRQLNAELETRNRELSEALARIETLEGMLPICSKCKKIRDADDRWVEVTKYVRDRTRAEFTHGICPDCLQELYGDLL